MTEYYRWLYAYVFNRLHSFSDTEDVLQETYLCALLNRLFAHVGTVVRKLRLCAVFLRTRQYV
jgi:DNA-directed RNA polymerase specialized sigma24 family protein